MPRRGANNLKVWLGVLYGALMACAVTLVVLGVLFDSDTGRLGGAVSIIVVGATAPVAFLLVALGGAPGETAEVARMLEEVREHTMLSDAAKRVLFRDREIQLLRNAIEDDIARGDYNAAITLCDEMANLFGYREEAEAFRSRIGQARQEHYELEVQAALDQFDASLGERNWAAVHQQAARIRRLYPDSHLVGDLDMRIQHARDEHKHQLETQLLDAAQKDDPERAMELLKQLDRYLTREEAERFTEVAQGVIVRHRQSLGARFRQSISEHRWAEAAQLGEMIATEFPNSKMAEEVRPMLEVLRARAGQAAVGAEEPT